MLITIANSKGGVAKTTLATHLATYMARKGWRTVLMDLDSQGNVARFLGLSPADDVAELFYAVLNLRVDRRPPLTSFLTPVPGYPHLAVIRGGGRSAALEADLRRPEIDRPEQVLREALSPLLDNRHICIVVDTGPSAGKVQEAALAASDHVIVPGIPEAATEGGILDIARRLKAVGRGITAVIPTRYIPAAIEHRRTIRDWQDALGAIVYYRPREGLVGLPRRVIWGELVRYGRPIWDLAPRHQAAAEMEAVVRRIAYDTALER